LIYLLVIIGLGQYKFFLGKDFGAQIIKAGGAEQKLHDITSEILIPNAEVEAFRGHGMTTGKRDELSDKFKVSPSALVTTLWKRGILSRQEYEALKPAPYVKGRIKSQKRSPKVGTSVRKFCGKISTNAIIRGIQTRQLFPIQAQYLIWGAPNKKNYRKYLGELGI